MNEVPNGPRIACVLCHTNTSTAVSFNVFGEDVRVRLYEGRPNWSVLHELDSDGDTQTNGEELGDPCGVWFPGQIPGRFTELSRPGDATSTSSTPKVPSCGLLDAGAADADPEETVSFLDASAHEVGGEDRPHTDAPDVSLPDGGEAPGDEGCACASLKAQETSLVSWLVVTILLAGFRRRVFRPRDSRS